MVLYGFLQHLYSPNAKIIGATLRVSPNSGEMRKIFNKASVPFKSADVKMEGPAGSQGSNNQALLLRDILAVESLFPT